jgi:hypothetical protein
MNLRHILAAHFFAAQIFTAVVCATALVHDARAADRAVPNMLAGKPLRYLIGADGSHVGEPGTITEVGYDAARKPRHGIGVKYANLFDEKNSGRYGPYLEPSDTAAQYSEGQIDPRGDGWRRNVTEQLARARAQGFAYIEWDNADAYAPGDLLGVIDISRAHGLRVIAKNPGLLDDGGDAVVSHPDVHGIIVEKGAGTPEAMDRLRTRAGRPMLPVWFVGFDQDGREWVQEITEEAKRYANMGVTISTDGEYGNAVDVARPWQVMIEPPPEVQPEIQLTLNK